MIEKFKGFLARRKTFAVLAIAVLILGALSAISWSTPLKRSYKEIVEFKESRGVLKHKAYLKDNEIYGPVLSGEYYPEKLLKVLHIDYEFKSDYKEGDYKFYGEILYKTKVGNDEYVLWSDKFFEKDGKIENGYFKVERDINISALNERISKVSSVLGVRRLETEINLKCQVDTGKFEHTVKMVRDPTGLIYFSNTEKAERYPKYAVRSSDTYVSAMGFNLKTGLARVLFTLLLTLVLPPFVYSTYSLLSRKPKKRLLDKIAVSGRFDGIKTSIILDSEEDLKKVYEIVDKPIVKCEDGYAVIDGDVAYVYKGGEWR